MEMITFKVREVNQMASGGSYVVGYTADVELTGDSSIGIYVESTVPADVDADFVAYAVGHTRDGFSNVLEPLRLGAKVRLSHLVLHEIDYKQNRQEVYSAIGMADALLQYVGRERAVRELLLDIEEAKASGVYSGTLKDLAAELDSMVRRIEAE